MTDILVMAATQELTYSVSVDLIRRLDPIESLITATPLSERTYVELFSEISIPFSFSKSYFNLK